MTENEAITQLKIQRTFTNGANAKVQAIDMAIQALEENQQYHAFGTVEEIDSMFKSGTKTLELSKKVIETAMCKLGKYEAIGTIEELQALKEKAEKDEITDSDNSIGLKVNWDNFIVGEAELECETIEDAELLLNICKENNIDCNYITADQFQHEPYWYVKDGTLETTRYVLDDDSICSLWTVRQFVEEHTL